MTLPLPRSYPPMEALLVHELPVGPEWQYEPKWDGFRCLAFRDGARVDLQSKAGKSLTRYFPEVITLLGSLAPRRFVLDGELLIPVGDQLSFDALLMRIHPAASRVQRLALEHPARFMAFDLLVDPRGRSLVDLPLAERRSRLEKFMTGARDPKRGLLLSPATRSRATVRRWFQAVGDGLDGVIAKRLDLPYRSGSRDGMQKVKELRSADCVVGGFRYASAGRVVGSLLLGLYDSEGLLQHVGFTANLPADAKPALTKRLERLRKPPGFTGRAPGGPSRWSSSRSEAWEPLAPRLVCEVQYDHFTSGRFRHGTGFLRWRPDKKPAQCTLAQVKREATPASALPGKPTRGTRARKPASAQ